MALRMKEHFMFIMFYVAKLYTKEKFELMPRGGGCQVKDMFGMKLK